MIPRVAGKWLTVLVVAGMLGACTAPGPRTGFAETDDLEPFSRTMLAANKRLDTFVLRPAAQGYDVAMPLLFQHLIGNGISHLGLTGDLANYLLQGDVDRSLDTLGRLVLNTFMGIGVLDPATEFGLPRQGTDFGLTLASYGVGEGSYLVLPLIGPTTMRDAAGFVVDQAFSPTTYIGQFTPLDAFGPTVTALDLVDRRHENFDLIDEALYEAEDPYITIRSAYLQNRRAKVAGEEGIEETLPDIFEDIEEPGAEPAGTPTN